THQLYGFHLPVFQLDRHGPAEDRQFDAHGALGFEDFLHFAFHAGEGAVLDLDLVAAIEARLGRFAVDRLHVLLLALHELDFVVLHRLGLDVQPAADEVAHAGGLAEQIENPVVVLDVDHQIARVALALLDDALAVAHLGDALDRDDDLAEVLLQAFDLDAAFDGVLDGLLAA